MAKSFPHRTRAPLRPQLAAPRQAATRSTTPVPPQVPKPAPAPAPAASTAWEGQAAWYDQRQGDAGHDLYRDVLLPVVLKRLAAKAGQQVLDLGCGQGVLGRALAQLRVGSLGVDASPALIEAARTRAGSLERHVVGDIRRLASVVGEERFDHAALVMVLQDLDPLEPVLAGLAGLLKPGGRLVIALSHPCFRQIRRSSWGWDEENRAQYRRIDGYLTPYSTRLATHPGAAHGTAEAKLSTTSHHRPLSGYIEACGKAGLGVVGCDELCNPRRGTKGVRFIAEDRAANEIPLFLLLTAQRS